jgi:hypothetical protein
MCLSCSDAQGRLETVLIAVDALYFGMIPELRLTQVRLQNVVRELNKAYVGFNVPKDEEPTGTRPLATGNCMWSSLICWRSNNCIF